MSEPANGRVTYKALLGAMLALLVPLVGVALAVGRQDERIRTNATAIEKMEGKIDEIHSAIIRGVWPGKDGDNE